MGHHVRRMGEVDLERLDVELQVVALSEEMAGALWRAVGVLGEERLLRVLEFLAHPDLAQLNVVISLEWGQGGTNRRVV